MKLIYADKSEAIVNNVAELQAGLDRLFADSENLAYAIAEISEYHFAQAAWWEDGYAFLRREGRDEKPSYAYWDREISEKAQNRKWWQFWIKKEEPKCPQFSDVQISEIMRCWYLQSDYPEYVRWTTSHGVLTV